MDLDGVVTIGRRSQFLAIASTSRADGTIASALHVVVTLAGGAIPAKVQILDAASNKPVTAPKLTATASL